MLEDELADSIDADQPSSMPDRRGGQAQSLRWILGKANSPEVHERIREAVRLTNAAADPLWRDLVRDADVVLHGGPEGSIIILPSRSNPAMAKDISELGEEAFHLLTSAGQVDVVVNFAEDILASPAHVKALDQMSSALGKTGLAEMSPTTLVLVVLVWLIAFGLPLATADLPAKDQSIITNEIATLAIALAVTWRLSDKRKD